MARVRFLEVARHFCVPHNGHTGCEDHPGSYPVGSEGFSPWLKLPEREANHSSSAEVEIGGAIHRLSHVLMARCLNNKAQEELYLLPFTFNPTIYSFNFFMPSKT
jgi:hypothetical protein